MLPKLLNSILFSLRVRFSKVLPVKKLFDEQPLRAELFSIDQLELYAKKLAGKHAVTFKKGREKLLSRLKENEEMLLRANELLDEAGKAKRSISPAGEWLLDNYYLIEEQIRLAQKYLPKGYSRGLPYLSRGPLAGYPRIYDIAMEIVSHGDGRLDLNRLIGFVSAYQTVKNLKLGELWGIPIMIRLALIENLRRVSVRMMLAQTDTDIAANWANRILEVSAKDSNDVVHEVASMAKADLPISDSFVAEFVRRLHGQSSSLNLPLIWLEKKLSEHGETIDRLIQSTSQTQASNQVSIANTIESLRVLEGTNWHDFVEKLSAVEKILLQDPTGDYSTMSFDTRDSYRHVIEKLSYKSGLTEEKIASSALSMAKEARIKTGELNKISHIGYYLVDKGLEQFYRSLGLNLPFSSYLDAKKTTLSLIIYIGYIAAITFTATAVAMYIAHSLGWLSWQYFAISALPLLFVASQTAVSVVNWFSTILVNPKKLPRMDFSSGIPPCAHTLVVVPAMLTGPATIDRLIENIEVSYLANTDVNTDFALLTDFHDAAEQKAAGDEELQEWAAAGIEKLNSKYTHTGKNIFYLFHRGRAWNAVEKKWMGHERKRGKLSDLNSILRGKSPDRFSLIKGDISFLQNVKYVITLDADTRMPRNVARDMVSIIEHPLNRPIYDARRKRVISGYGILQPRVESSYPGENPTLFVKIYGGESGIDPYTRTVSDVYQDLFHEGSFIGKGLYDVDAFESSLKEQLPENLILSHDMLEGCYARSALVTDVQLHEQYPAGYLQDMNRRRRWMRGDWQIAGWLFSKVKGFNGKQTVNPLTFLSKWKIFDNLRRSLVSPSAVFLLLAGWFTFKSSWVWTLMLIVFAGLPMFARSLAGAVKKPEGISTRAHMGSTFSLLSVNMIQFCLSLAFIVYEAYAGLGAAIITIWRLLVSHRGLLEWNTQSKEKTGSRKTIFDYYIVMFISPLAVLLCLVFGRGFSDAPAIFLAVVWLAAPFFAGIISTPVIYSGESLTAGQIIFLRKLARKTWNFFETFVDAEDNWLPPDNFQEHPLNLAAHRTSPTNIGLSLLSDMTAYDFGYVSMGVLLKRTTLTLNTMSLMARFKGHFYNWYDTRTLKPLEPLYVSSVDSGNLAGNLLVMRSGLTEMINEKILSVKMFDGLNDALYVLDESAGKYFKSGGDHVPGALHKVAERINYLKEKLSSPPSGLSKIRLFLLELQVDMSRIHTSFEHKEFETIKKWAQIFEKQCLDHLNEISFMAPWSALPQDMPVIPSIMDEQLNLKIAALKLELQKLDDIPFLGACARLEQQLIPMIDEVLGLFSGTTMEQENLIQWLAAFQTAIQDAGTHASERIKDIYNAALLCGEMSVVEYEFLYNKVTRFLSIGYNVSENRMDPGSYDLLASESRLGSFVAIAQGRMPQEQWFMLGRLLSKHGGEPILISWGGSMFEYLMPLLIMPTYDGTLLDRTYKSVILRQINYARRNNMPWGISESGYNKINSSFAYQYHSFGVPDTGFKRGLSEDLVVAPYASALALMVSPAKACENLEYMNSSGFQGEYGFYEAIDYTPSRLAPDETHALVKSYMAHHQGMSFLSFANVLLGKPMQRRFLAEPSFKATELLLQERVPHNIPFLYDIEVTGPLRKFEDREALLRVFTGPDTPFPEVHLLSNGSYNVMVTNSGGGYSRWKDLALTRWNEDAAMEDQGTFVYIRDMKSGRFWSTAYQPAMQRSNNYEAVFSRSRAEFKRRDHLIDTHTEIAVSPEDDIELRRITVTNRSHNKRSIELTSYAKVVLNFAAADKAHMSFSNLFIQTEIIKPYQAIICTRRPRSEKEQFPIMLHLMAVHGNSEISATYETDRNKFIGRCNTLAYPAVMKDRGHLSDSEGDVLDPIVSIRCRVELEPDESAVIDYVTGVCSNRADAQRLMEKYRDRNLADRVFDLAWTHGQVALQQINATETDALLYGRLAGAIIYANPSWRAQSSILRRNYRGQSDLWGHSISGDLPIVLVRIEDMGHIAMIERMVQAHSYWRMNGLAVDLVIWNEDHSVYRDEMAEKINALISENAGRPSYQPGGIFLRRADQMSEEDKVLIQTAARVIINDRAGTLLEQLNCAFVQKLRKPLLVPVRKVSHEKPVESNSQYSDLKYFNGLGGFTNDGREYVITTGRFKATPAPWVNVLANKDFGTVVTESGSSYTWSENAHEFRLTPWKNDPVTDLSGEAFYIRDEETGYFWSPSPMPAKGETNYVTRHGFGYTIFDHTEKGIISELTVFVPLEHPVKCSVLKIKNISGRKRNLSVVSYNELVMGTLRDKYLMHIVTEVDPKSGAFLSYNHYNKDFPGRVVFLDCSESKRFVSGDRHEFLGRNNTLAAPEAMKRESLSGKTGAGLDPCACMQVKFEIYDNDEKEIVFTLGSGKNTDEARNIISHFKEIQSVKQELEKVWEYWKRTLGVVYVETPDESLNFLVNGWLQYQTISCRLWGRSGYYQSGGAYGYRDQLQDVMSLTHSHPEMMREQLIKFAGHQFIEGDVQHWWHPPGGRGVRSRCSDDFLWLPFVTCQYVNQIGDTGVLDEPIQFLEGPLLKPEEESYYNLPGVSANTGTLYEHCVAAVKHALRFGIHGLPLIGSGDWNDGMNLVGEQGKGESVWLAFFLYKVLNNMAKLALVCKDNDFSETCIMEAEKLLNNIENNAWDGKWYIRAFFDNGDPLGASSNAECNIDSIPQSWSVISEAAGIDRAIQSMNEVDQRLVDRKNALIKIFDPPFDKGVANPGYVKGYVPGVRENGGQYTHAAIWAAMAYAELKDNKKAWEMMDMINPIKHADTQGKCGVYKVEPYVMAADVYSDGKNTGRGGWTWYTGSASWMYQFIVGNLLGLSLKVDRLYFTPCWKEGWQSYKIHYRYKETFYHITVKKSGQTDKVQLVTVDNIPQQNHCIKLVDDRAEHNAEVAVGGNSAEKSR